MIFFVCATLKTPNKIHKGIFEKFFRCDKGLYLKRFGKKIWVKEGVRSYSIILSKTIAIFQESTPSSSKSRIALLSKFLPKFKGKEAFIYKTQVIMTQRKKEKDRKKSAGPSALW